MFESSPRTGDTQLFIYIYESSGLVRTMKHTPSDLARRYAGNGMGCRQRTLTHGNGDKPRCLCLEPKEVDVHGNQIAELDAYLVLLAQIVDELEQQVAPCPLLDRCCLPGCRSGFDALER